MAFQLDPRAFRIQTEVRIMSWLTAQHRELRPEAGGSRAFISSKVVAHMAMAWALLRVKRSSSARALDRLSSERLKHICLSRKIQL